MSGQVAGDAILHSVADGVLTICLNRPAVRNALLPEMFTHLADLFAAAETDADVQLVLLTGAGPSFSSGGDAKARPESFAQAWAEATRLILAAEALRKPLVSQVQGHAIGFGCTLALLADFVIATVDTKFHYPFVHMGLVPEGTRVAARVLPPALARSFIMLGEPLSGASMAAAGVIHRAVAAGELQECVAQLLRSLLALPPGAFANCKRALQVATAGDLAASLEWERVTQSAIRSSPGYAEFRAAFFRKAGVGADRSK